MIRVTTFIFITLLVVACDSKPLSEMECKILTNMELDFATDRAGEDAKAMREFMADAAESSTAKCVAGNTYNRSDYKCLIRATDMAEKAECFADVTARIRK